MPTLQILNPDCNDGTMRSRLPEGGVVSLTTGQASLTVAFVNDKLTPNYIFDEWEVENLTDSNPLAIIPVRTSRSTTGFTVEFAPTPDSNNYRFRWHVRLP